MSAPRRHVAVSLLSQGSPQWTGTWTSTRELIRELGRRPDEVALDVLVNEHGWQRLSRWAPDNVAVRRVRGYSVGTTTARRMLAMASTAIWPAFFERQIPRDAELVHYPLTLNVPPVRRRRVMTLHDIQHHDLPSAFSTAQLRWRALSYDRAARHATFVVTVSEHARRRIIEVVGVRPERIATVHNGVDGDRFAATASVLDRELLAPLGLPERFVYYPASLWPHKNHLALLDALARVEDPDLTLVLSGATFGRLQAFETEVRRRDLSGRVRHLQFVDDAIMPALYRAARALVFPSRYEGFGLPPLEAMACGCPVASSLAGSLAEVCGGAVAPLDPDSSEQMADAIDRVVDDERCRARLRTVGARQVKGFTWARSADQLLAAYDRAVSLDPPTGATKP